MDLTVKLFGFLIILQTLVKVLPGQSNTCIECERNPNACRKIAGIFMVTVLSEGTYNPVVEIPTGACHINITELGLSQNFLAVKTKGSRSTGIINGFWSIVPTGTYRGAGTVFRYGSQSGPSCPGQCIFTDGSVNQTVVIQLLYYSKNPGISYQFLLPNYIPFTPYEGTFVPQTPHTIRHQRHHRRHRSRDRTRGHYTRPTSFEGEYNPGYYRRIKNRYDNTQEFRTGGSSVNRRHEVPRQNIYENSRTDTSPKSYGHDTLGGHGLSYTKESDKSEDNPLIKVVQRPRYVSPYDNNRRFAGQDTLELRSGQTYVRGISDSRPRSVKNEIRNTYHQKRRPVGHQTNVQVGASGSQYMWRISGFTQCSHTCGGGHQQTQIVCVSRSSSAQVIVTEENCNNAIKPSLQTVECNTKPCAPNWEGGDWSDCSVTCGSGTQTRRVECKQRMTAKVHLSISASKCDARSRPAIAQQCEKGPCAMWKSSKWGKCSVKCGAGEQRRKVKCVDHQNTQIPDRFCDGSAPESKRPCNQGTCEKQWWMSAWSGQCSNECGTGVKTRTVICGTKNGNKLPESMCELDRKPDSKSSCRSQTSCGGKWFTGPWGKCSTVCGNGVRRRDVVCMNVIGTALSVTREEKCDSNAKPVGEEGCHTDACGSEWYMSDWSKCSVTCGSGVKARDVKCLNKDKRRSRTCDRAQKPASREVCQMADCSLPQATRASARCRDQYRSCLMVIQARLCMYPYYRQICCASCRSAKHS